MSTATDEQVRTAPYRPLPIRPTRIRREDREDGSILLTTDFDLPAQHQSILHLLFDRARRFPDRPFLARRVPLDGGGWGDWRKVSFGDAADAARRLGQAMIDRGIGPDHGVMVLSGPSIEHGLFMLGAHAARACYAPISTGYSLLSTDFKKLRHVFDTCQPKMIMVDDGELYLKALQSLPLDGVEVVAVRPSNGLAMTPFDELLATPAGPEVDASIGAITHDTVAKTIFTSGTTGPPKGVITTHGMLTAIVAQHDAFFVHEDNHLEEAGAQLGWLPWAHIGGTNIRFCDAINDAATFYIDEGRPTPEQFGESLRNLREISLSEFSSTPAFFNYLVPAMEADPALRDTFFRRLRLLTYGSATLPQDIFDRLQALSVAATGFRTPVTTKYGLTETQGVTIVPWPLEEIGPIGVPYPGMTIKLVPEAGRLEMRVKSDAVTPGYLGNPEATAKAFDEEGFFRTGDAGRMVDPDDPGRGLAFDGRVTENFKLTSGTWVAVGPLRGDLMAALGIVSEIIVAGHDRDEVRVMAWLRPDEAAAVAGGPAPMAELIRSPIVHDHLAAGLRAHNAAAGGASRRVTRLLLLEEPPAPDEVADKGSISQRATLERRRDLVTALFADPPPASLQVIVA